MIIQRTPEWLEMRRRFIGASDSGIIMNMNPFPNNTPKDLWERKLGLAPELEENDDMRRGNLLEKPALELFEKLTGYMCIPKVVFHPTISFMMASLDGMDIEGKAIVEIKAPRKISDQIMDGEIPSYHFPQLQHQMEVSGLRKSYYLAYTETSYKLIEVHYDQNYVENLLKEEAEFWDCVLTKTEPKVKSRYQQMTSKEWTHAADEYRDITRQIKVLEARQRACKDRLFAIAAGTPSQGGGVTVSKTIKKGIVDIELFAKDTGRDPEQYRKESREEWSVRVNGIG